MDDGSTDGSGAILDEYEAKDKRFRVIHQTNAGVSAARNKGLDVVKGEWIWFVDGDDVIYMHSLQALVNSIKEVSDCELIKIGYEEFNENGAANLQFEKPTYSKIDISQYVPVDVLDVMCWQIIYRADKVKKIRFRNYIGGEDRVFACSCLAKASMALELHLQCYGYRQRTSSVMHRKREYRKLHDDLCSLIDACNICDQSDKNMPFVNIWWAREFLNSKCLLEAMSFNRNERRMIWNIWRDAVSRLQCIRKLTLSERIALQTASNMPSLQMASMCLVLINRAASAYRMVAGKLRHLRV